MKKGRSLSLRLTPEATRALDRAAEDEIRTTAGMLEKIVVLYLREQGYLPMAKITIVEPMDDSPKDSID